VYAASRSLIVVDLGLDIREIHCILKLDESDLKQVHGGLGNVLVSFYVLETGWTPYVGA
jgi:hypothetical protein